MSFNPFYSLLKTVSYVLRGRIHFPKDHVGEVLVMEDGQKFTVFRHCIIDTNSRSADKPAIFKVRFHVAGMSSKENIRFSLIPIPFFVGLLGFRSKFWTVNESIGDFKGIYEGILLKMRKIILIHLL